uniref:Zgc:112962 n=1 Tax=Cyprinus carpio TaxID=7962 RepID=A0A8C1NC80_CYPCA
MANKGNSDTMQQGTDSTGHDTTEKSESSSELEEKQTGLSGDSLPDNVPKEDDAAQVHTEDTGMLSFQLSDTMQQGTDSTGHDTTEKSESSSELEEKQTDAVQQGTVSRSDPGHDTTEKSERSTEPEEKQTDAVQQGTDSRSDPGHDTTEKSESSSDSEEKQTEKTTQIRSSSETEKDPHSGTEPKRDMDREKGRKPERKEESLLNIQKPEEDTASDIHEEDVERDENVQPKIVPVNNKIFWTAAAVVLLAVVCALCQRSPDSTPPVQKEINVVDVFNQEMKKLETTFPNQHPELWRRSLIHLRRHLKTKNPTEPVSLILTSDHRAEKTLGCLAQCLARAFSTAHNTSVLNINGKNKASQDSVQVKLDIDSELKKAFEGKKSAAVIHHFEELPPGSTLIFYRYCDHENAAYKDVFLVFTVMLDPEVELTSNDSLGRVEEMVQDHIKQKFVSSDKSAMFNQMDVDKLGGLWSRISHLILPVAAEKKIEEQGCGDRGKSF